MTRFNSDIADGNLSVENYLKNYCESNHKFELLLDSNGGKNREKILLSFIDYIQNCQGILQISQLLWLFNAQNVGQLMNLFVDAAKETSRFSKNPEYSRLGYRCRDILKKYKLAYNRTATKGIWKIEDTKYEINDDIIDQAIAYMHANDIFICQYTVNIICKNILLHKINYSEETLKTKEEMIEDIKEAKLLQASIFEELQNQPNIQAYWETYQKNRELIIQAIIQEKKATRKIKK